MCALYSSALYGGEAADWLMPRPWQQEGDNSSEGAYQSGNEYSTGVSLPGYFACYPPSQRDASHISSQGEKAASVTHDTLPQVVKASALYYKNKNICTSNHSQLTSAATLRADKSKK